MSTTYSLTMTGTAPLLMHAATSVDPLGEAARALKAISDKRKKTIEDHAHMARIEWDAGLYHDDTLGPIVLAEMVEGCIRDSAKAWKLGTEVTRALVVTDDVIGLEFDGPRDRDGLYAAGFVDRRAAKVGQARVMRTRPIFRSWALRTTLEVESDALDPDTLRRVVERAGRMTGIGDYRPRFGRFSTDLRVA